MRPPNRRERRAEQGRPPIRRGRKKNRNFDTAGLRVRATRIVCLLRGAAFAVAAHSKSDRAMAHRSVAWSRQSAIPKMRDALVRRLAFVMTAIAPVAIPAASQSTTYVRSADAPIAWREFALIVRERLQAWLAQDEDPVRRFRASLEERGITTLAARVWLLANGEIARVEFDGVAASGAAELAPFLARRAIGAAPPADLLQPLHLALSLQGKS